MFNFEMSTLNAGIQVMIYGLAGVFFVLILFYLATKIMFHYTSKLDKPNED